MLTQKGQTYTNPQGSTPQGNDVASTLAQLTQLNTQPELAGAMGKYGQELANFQTPQSRQGYITNSDLPAMQGNYEEIARRLYDYDKMYLNPMYSQAPGQPSDAPAFGRVEASNLMQLTPEIAGGPTSLYADNPTYAVSSQTAQKGSILDVLDSLNEAIGKEFTSRRGQYASTVKAKESILDTVSKLLDKRVEIDEREKDRAMEWAKFNSKEKPKEDLVSEVQSGANLDTVMKKYSTKIEPDEILRLYNTHSLWGPATESNEELNKKYGVALSKVTDKLTPGAKSQLSEDLGKIANIQDAYDALQKVSAQDGGFLSDIFTGATGPLAKFKGGYLSGKEARQKIATLEADIKKGVYGSVLSKYELSQAENWVPSTRQQESINLMRLQALLENARNGIRERLRAYDLPDAEIEAYMNKTLGGAGGGSSNLEDLYKKFGGQ